MSHEIYKDDSMFSVIEVPWHKLGTILETHPTKSEEALKLAGLDWEVALEPVFLSDGQEIEDFHATVRKDTNKPLGVVGNKYKVVQNSDAFKFFDGVLDGNIGFYETAGSLKHGKIIWALMRLPETIVVRRKNISDPVKEYLLLTSSHDGSGAVKAMMTPVRVVCNNTLTMAVRGAEYRISARHTEKAAEKLAEAVELLGIVRNKFSVLGDTFQMLGNAKLDKTSFDNFIEFCLPIPETAKEGEASTRLINQRAAINTLYETNKALDNWRGTWWGAYNSVTHYVDHESSGRNNADTRLQSIWLGNKAELKSRALTLAVYGAENGMPNPKTVTLDLSRVKILNGAS